MGDSDTQTEYSRANHTSTTLPNKTPQQNAYIGRFAPSPTGPLHFGSLVAAVASYLCARQYENRKWLLRIEDIDTQREQKGATESIIRTLESYGFEWDGDITYQSQRSDLYTQALESISELIYPCSCTRKSLMASTGSYSYIYPGLCRDKPTNSEAVNLSIRVKTNADETCFQDKCQPEPFCQNINKDIGDFILKRSDGLWGYQLAVVVDDALQQITEVVRGADLFDNTPRQLYLHHILNINKHTPPSFLHFPVVVDTEGKKLSKQNLSPEISADKKRATLIQALKFLGHNPPDQKEFSNLNDCWKWAIVNWDNDKIPKIMTSLSE